jgi:hypothetical protein
MCRGVRGWLFLVFGLIARRLRDWATTSARATAIRWFGKVEYGDLIPENMQAMLLDAPRPAA